MKLFKKCISPVVATALLLVVAVVSVVGFQGWFNEFSSSVFVEVESDSSSSTGAVRVEGLIDDNLYLFSDFDGNLTMLKVLDKSNDIVCEYNYDELNKPNLIGNWGFENKNSTHIFDSSYLKNDVELFKNDLEKIQNFENQTR